ncbi:hypothetical protein [Streptomyces sp. NBC_01465]|uniref:hypothetical protein n=1 Tax=Streptomyces sp. NBC_01465 TaxID=2903878 RepID=UPI002E359863|nr:hypothetical protein [Streptomyces sp. NBC_01465]
MDLFRYPRAALGVAVAALLLAGCSDSSPSKPAPSTGSSSSPSTSAAPTTSAPAAGAPADQAAAKQQIEKNWAVFFDPKTPTDDKVKVLENGNTLRPLLALFSGDKNATQAKAKVTAVAFTSATSATVTYDLMVGTTTALPGSKGTSVLQDRTWKVSVKSLCALVALSGNAAAPGC